MDKSPVKFIRAGAFGLAILFFFMPFALVSCPGNKSTSVTGMQLISGRTIKGSELSAWSDNARIRPSITALIASLCAVAGIVGTFLKPKISFALGLAASAVGLICMALLKTEILAWAARNSYHNLKVSLLWGYWAAIVSFCGALILTLVFNPFIKWKFPAAKRRAKRRR